MLCSTLKTSSTFWERKCFRLLFKWTIKPILGLLYSHNCEKPPTGLHLTKIQRQTWGNTSLCSVCVPPLCPSPPHMTPNGTFTFLTHSRTSSQPKHPLRPGLPWPLSPCFPLVPQALQTTSLHTCSYMEHCLSYWLLCTLPSVKHSPSCCPHSPCSAK